jgi:hypothetical protein
MGSAGARTPPPWRCERYSAPFSGDTTVVVLCMKRYGAGRPGLTRVVAASAVTLSCGACTCRTCVSGLVIGPLRALERPLRQLVQLLLAPLDSFSRQVYLHGPASPYFAGTRVSDWPRLRIPYDWRHSQCAFSLLKSDRILAVREHADNLGFLDLPLDYAEEQMARANACQALSQVYVLTLPYQPVDAQFDPPPSRYRPTCWSDL